MLLCLMGIGSLQAQSPGGVSTGLVIWHHVENGTTDTEPGLYTRSGIDVNSWKNVVDGSFAINNGSATKAPDYTTANGTRFNFNPYFSYNNTANTLGQRNTVANSGYWANEGTKGMHLFMSHFFTSAPTGWMFAVNNNASANAYDWPEFNGTNAGSSGAPANYRFYTLPNNEQSIFDARLNESAQTGGSDNMTIKNNLTTFVNASVFDCINGGMGYVIGDDQVGDLGSTNLLTNEVIAYNAPLSALDEQRVQSYLAIRNGITLAQNYIASDGTTTHWTYTGNATYSNNIAGIGRDENTALYQKQSLSMNAGTQVVMSVGAITASNPTNANTITTDKQFLVWGDNGITTPAVTKTGGFSPVRKRLTKIWKLQNTNAFNQSVTVYYPAAALNPLLGNTVYLLYSNNAAFANGFTNGTPVLGGAAVTIIDNTGVSKSYIPFTVTFPTTGTQYFTFGGLRTSVMVNPATINTGQQNGRLK